MNDKNIKTFNGYIKLIEQELKKYSIIATENRMQGKVIDAMNYSLEAGGKRIRPILILEFCRVCGGDYRKAVSSACAMEMIHTFSLIHDDLPGMDDDDYRRGKPSCHKAFGEALAILAGDALSVKAFEIIINDSLLDSDIKIKLISLLADSVGVNGMIGGQVMDIENENRNDISEDNHIQMCIMKTGALLKAACKMGCIIAGAEEKIVSDAGKFGEDIGLAFQIIDDILDVKGDQDILGKPVGSDEKQHKATFITLYGVAKCKDNARILTDRALTILNRFNDNGFLYELTQYLLVREK